MKCPTKQGGVPAGREKLPLAVDGDSKRIDNRCLHHFAQRRAVDDVLRPPGGIGNRRRLGIDAEIAI